MAAARSWSSSDAACSCPNVAPTYLIFVDMSKHAVYGVYYSDLDHPFGQGILTSLLGLGRLSPVLKNHVIANRRAQKRRTDSGSECAEISRQTHPSGHRHGSFAPVGNLRVKRTSSKIGACLPDNMASFLRPFAHPTRCRCPKSERTFLPARRRFERRIFLCLCSIYHPEERHLSRLLLFQRMAELSVMGRDTIYDLS